MQVLDVFQAATFPLGPFYQPAQVVSCMPNPLIAPARRALSQDLPREAQPRTGVHVHIERRGIIRNV